MSKYTKKFEEFQMINESVQPHYVMSLSQLYKLAFEIFENANTKEEAYGILEEQMKIFVEERKIPLDIPKGAMM